MRRMCQFIILILCIIAIGAFYCGFRDDPNNYQPTKATIANKSLETMNAINNSRQMATGLNVFSQHIKYRMKVTYSYTIDDHTYNKSFYQPNKFVSRDEIKTHWSNYNIGDTLKVYYDIQHPSTSRKSIKNIKFGLRYYLCGLIALSFLVIIRKYY